MSTFAMWYVVAFCSPVVYSAAIAVVVALPCATVFHVLLEQSGATPLHTAASLGHSDILQYLTAHGGDVTALDKV